MGAVKSDRGAWAEGLKVKHLPAEGAEVLFFAGCRISYDKELQQNARATVQILLDAGVDLGILGENEMCCGGRIYSMGYQDEFTRLANSNLAVWKKADVKTVVTSCSDGYHAFKRLYPQLGSDVEVLHTVEYIDRLIKDGQLKFSKEVPLNVTYHDLLTPHKRHAFAAVIRVFAIELTHQVILLVASLMLVANNNGFVVTGM